MPRYDVTQIVNLWRTERLTFDTELTPAQIVNEIICERHIEPEQVTREMFGQWMYENLAPEVPVQIGYEEDLDRKTESVEATGLIMTIPAVWSER